MKKIVVFVCLFIFLFAIDVSHVYSISYLNSNYLTIAKKTIEPIFKQKVSNIKIVQVDYKTNRLTWKKLNNVTGYKIYVSLSKKGKYKKIGVSKTNNFNHYKVEAGKTYFYKIRPYKYYNEKDQYGVYSDVKSKTVKLVRPKLEVIAEKNNSLRLKYNKVPKASYYQIYRSTDEKKYTYLASTNKISYEDKKIRKNTTYYYKVRAVSKKYGKKTRSEFSKVDHETTTEANAKYKLNLTSVYGDNEAYHPDILYFENGWNNYKYWLAFTPYPRVKDVNKNGDEKKENPHIKVSNDMKKWAFPEAMVNPLDDSNNKLANTYNSDTDLIYNPDLDRIECFWRTYNQDNQNIIYMKYTSDGKNWSHKQKIYSVSKKSNQLLSPSFVYENKGYKMWYVDDYKIKYLVFNSLALENQKKEKNINIDTESLEILPWHIDVIKVDNKYRMIFVGTTKRDSIRYMSLYYSESIDGIKWSKPFKILSPSKDKSAWDNRGIYRSSLLYKDRKWYIFYSASNRNNVKGTSIIYGENIKKLRPLFYS